ncbi:MAG: hypothetical protein ACKO38_13590 [Planctomycetota bacterium]
MPSPPVDDSLNRPARSAATTRPDAALTVERDHETRPSDSPRTQRWRAALRSAGVAYLIGIPDSSTAELFGRPLTTLAAGSPERDVMDRDPPERKRPERQLPDLERPAVITVCREGEAFALAAGLWAGGVRCVVWMQSTGLFASGDSIRSVGQELRVPVPLVVGWRGRLGKPNAGQFDTATELLEPTLQAWRIPYVLAETPDAFELAEWLESFAWDDPGVRALVVPQ